MGDLTNHHRDLLPGQPVQRHLGEVGAPRPGRAEVRAKGQERQDARGRGLINKETEQLQRRRIDPVQVFHDKQHWLLGGGVQHHGQESVQGLLLLLLG
jgi:hypothetical protein